MKQFKYVILSMIVLSMCLVLTACGGPESTYADAQKEEKYVSAMQYINEEKYEEAYSILSTIKDYKDVSNIILNNKNIAAVRETALTPFKKEGGYITLGAYYQSNSIAKEPIEWIVLKYDSETNRTLVVSRYALVRADYISDTSQITWKNSNIRAWLNRTFYAEAFSEDEKEVIPLVTLDGDETMDWVFCLSTGQIGYLGTEADRRCSPTAYAIEQGVWQYDGWDRSKQLEGSGCCYWWIRSDLDGWYMFISPDGRIYVNNENSGYYRNAVRPALWIDLNAM